MNADDEIGLVWQNLIANATIKVTELVRNNNIRNVNEEILINFIYENCKRILSPITRWIDGNVTKHSTKDEKISESLRKEGNYNFQKNDYAKSLYLYTKSILHAPKKSSQLALAYANRSAVHFRSASYKNCISDIENCLQNPYPEELKEKVRERLTKCLKYCNEQDDSQFDDVHQLPCPFSGFNPAFCGASAVLKIKSDNLVGKYVVASEDIEQGAILFVETPYCSYSAETDLSACSFCCSKANLSTPCERCCKMFYCSTLCHDRCWQLFHKWECLGLQSLLGPYLGIAPLATRILLKASHENFSLVAKDDDNLENSMSCSYMSVRNLISNFDKMSLEDSAAYGVIAVLLVYYLKSKTDFFEWVHGNFGGNIRELARFLSSLLLKHLCQLQCNAHSVEEKYDEMSVHRTAIYPSASVMNHSCDSNILNEYFKHYLIVRAARKIRKDEEVVNCYGVSYLTHTTSERQDKLSLQYYFTCKCKPCSHPDLNKYYELRKAIKCAKCNGRLIFLADNYKCFDCSRVVCGVQVTADKFIKLFQSACDQRDRGELFEALKLMKICVFDQSYDLLDLYDRIINLYEIKGELDKSIELCKKKLEIIASEHGEFCYLAANEKLRIAEMMANRVNQMKENRCSKKDYGDLYEFLSNTHDHLSVFYGPWNEKIKLINVLKDQVVTLLNK